MVDSSKDWPIILDGDSYTYLVELLQNLCKVEGLVKRLVDGEYQWHDKSYKLSQNFTKDNLSWDIWYDNLKQAYDDDNNWPDWHSIGTGEGPNDSICNSKSEFMVRWEDDWDAEPNWSSSTSKSETSVNWDSTKLDGWDKGVWEKEWINSESKESNQDQIDWGISDFSGW